MKSRVWFVCLLAFLLSATSVLAQQQRSTAKSPAEQGHADAYYHYTLGHLYAELAASVPNHPDYLDKAIDNYRAALEADPGMGYLVEELSELYIMAGRMREAEQQAQDTLKKDPNNITARRILARIYYRQIADNRQRPDEEMVKRAIEQYKKLSELQPKDVDVWVDLGRLNKILQKSPEAEAAYNKALEIEPDNEDALIGLAVVYQDLGDRAKVSEILRRIVASDPSPNTLTALARSYEQQDEYGLAAETYRQAVAMTPDNAALQQALAQNLAMSGHQDEALEIYQKLVEKDPSDAESHLRISQIYTRKGEFDKAWAELQEAKKSAPDSTEVLYHEINLLESMGKTSDAIARLKELLDNSRKTTYSTGERANRALFLERLAVLYRSDEQYDNAVKTFEELRDLDPDLDARVSAQIGDTYRQGRQFQKAADVLNDAFKKYPDNRTIAVVRATVLADLGDSDKAVAAIEKLTKGRNDLDSYMTLAQIYEKTKRFPEMAQAIQKALEVASNDDERSGVLFMQGAMYERQKRIDEAETSFRKVLELDPDNSSALNYLGYMFADQDVKLDEALNLIKKALELEPNNGAYLDSLGWVYYRMDRLDEAETYLRQAVDKVSTDPVVHDHLGDVYFQEGNLKDAITHWRISLQNWATSSAAEKDPAQIAALQKKLEGAEVRLAREAGTAAKP